MKNKYLFLVACSVMFTSYGQKNSLSSGGEGTGTGGTSSYSIGQIDYSNTVGSSEIVTEGVQQPYELYTLSIPDSKSTMGISIFPNPTADILTIRFESILLGHSVQLIDNNGKELFTIQLNQLENSIDMKEYSQGIYQLLIRNNDKTIQHIKIIKN